MTGWNRSPQKDVVLAASPIAAVEGADVVVSMLTDDEASQTVWIASGAIDAVRGDALAIESSTITHRHATALGGEFASRGIAFVEAPVVGSRPQAEARQLVVLAGGEPTAVARATEIMAATAAGVRHIGPIGAAAVMKLAINGLLAAQIAAFSEIIGLIAKSELDTGAAIGLLKNLPITSPALQRILGLIETNDYAPNFPIPLVAKDLSYLTDLASTLGADTPLATATRELFVAAAADAETVTWTSPPSPPGSDRRPTSPAFESMALVTRRG